MNLKPTTPEQRDEIYKDVRQLIVPGFLSHTAIVGKTDIALRSLYPSDLVLLTNRVGYYGGDRIWKEWIIASSMWVIDGQVVLSDQQSLVRIRKTLVGVPGSVLDVLMSIVMGLMNRYRESISMVEAFSYENSSRWLWREIGTRFSEVVGISGLSDLGQNMVQQTWAALNHGDDEISRIREEWGRARFLASVHVPKVVKRMSLHDDLHQKREEQRRQEVMDKAYWKAKGYSVSDSDLDRVYPKPRSKSADELIDEYRRWVAGEMDFHDRVVAEHKEKIKQRVLKERERIRRQEEAYDRAMELRQDDPVMPLVGYTQEQLNEILSSRGGRQAGVSSVYEGGSGGRVFDQFLSGREVPSPGLDKYIQMKEKKMSLNEKIANRQVRER